jgi:hypothetical protein
MRRFRSERHAGSRKAKRSFSRHLSTIGVSANASPRFTELSPRSIADPFRLDAGRLTSYSVAEVFLRGKGVVVRKMLMVAACAFLLSASAASGSHLAAPATAFTPNKKISQSTSSNWAGYSAVNGRYTSVSASWKQPTASCTSATTYSSFWVGLDGDGSNTVEQTGTSADCSGGVPRYYAWYEMYPKFPVNLSLTIRAGDSISGSVTTDGGGRFTLAITNNSTGQSFTTTQRMPRAKLASAEAIAEAPSSSGGVLPLTNFGTASFSATTVNGQPIGNFSPDRIDMVSGSTLKAQTSSLSGGTSFSVSWKHS